MVLLRVVDAVADFYSRYATVCGGTQRDLRTVDARTIPAMGDWTARLAGGIYSCVSDRAVYGDHLPADHLDPLCLSAETISIVDLVCYIDGDRELSARPAARWRCADAARTPLHRPPALQPANADEVTIRWC